MNGSKLWHRVTQSYNKHVPIQMYQQYVKWPQVNTFSADVWNSTFSNYTYTGTILTWTGFQANSQDSPILLKQDIQSKKCK